MGLSSDSCDGFCEACGTQHFLGEGGSRPYAVKLMGQLESLRTIDFNGQSANPALTTDYLFGAARGQMFGVLLCEDKMGNEVILKAFSCQYNSHWQVEGWVPPLLDVDRYNVIVPPVDIKIKDLSRKIEAASGTELLELKEKRKKISQDLMKEIHGLYSLHNFKSEEKTLKEAFCFDKGIPTGTGDCCAPKLLNFAAKHELKPLGLSEFYFGRENKSGTRKHGEFYSSCEAKCQPILGFLLCGLEK